MERNEVLKITRDLMAIRSVADSPDELSRAVEYVVDFFASAGAVVRRYECEGKPSLVVSSHDTLTPDVVLSGHLDVVPALSGALFVLREEGGRIYGRGACDMKASIAVMMLLMREYLRAPLPSTSVALMLTTDEEIGGARGAGYLVEGIGYRPGVVIIPDGGDELSEVVVGTKGIAHIKLSYRGVPAHASRPWLGDNAITGLLREYGEIQRVFSGNTPESAWVDTCNLSTITGGAAVNQVPDYAELSADIRFIEGRTCAEVVARIRTCAPSCEVATVARGEARYTALDHPALSLYANILRAEGIVPEFTKSHGTDDGRYFSVHGIPVIVSQALSGGHHSDDEWMDLGSLERWGEVVDRFVRRFVAV